VATGRTTVAIRPRRFAQLRVASLMVVVSTGHSHNETAFHGLQAYGAVFVAREACFQCEAFPDGNGFRIRSHYHMI
jgi:hypothetical protein